MRVAYFVHDLTDPAVGKRVRMLRAAGAEVCVLGFRRENRAPAEIEGAPTVDLGRTYDGRLRQRCLMVLKRRLRRRSWSEAIAGFDILMARNLEMLVLASAAKRHAAREAGLVYECLDVHRLLLSRRPGTGLLRFIERMLMRRAKLLVISSPAYLTEYFEPRQKLHRNWQIPILLVENKVLELEGESALQASDPVQELPPGPPWRIGWFGMIRCQKSLDILRDLVKARTGLVEVVIRGRPSLVEFRNFEAQVNTPGILFGRTYAPGEIGGLYRSVHFNWAIDYFEAGGNSELLLPNRIYEGGRHDAVPLALANTETGRWLKCHGLGLVVKSPANELAALFENLSAACYAELKQASLSAPRGAFVADGSDCQRLLEALAKTAARDAKKAAKNRTPSEPTFRLKAH